MRLFRGLGLLLVPPVVGVIGFAVLTLTVGDLPYSGLPGTRWLGSRRILDSHIVPMLVAAAIMGVHLAFLLGVLARVASRRGRYRASWSVLLLLATGFVVALEGGLLRTPLAEWPQELPVAFLVVGVPCLGMLWTAERLAFGPRATSAAPAGAI